MSDRDTSYNGWRNRETWLVNLWYNPSTKSDLEYAKADIEDQIEALPYGFIRDLLTSNIDWAELERCMDDADADEDNQEDDDDNA